jgi:hypothetical protein
MNIENCRKAANIIRTVPQKYFDMSDYRASRSGSVKIVTINQIGCGTIGCFLGHLPYSGINGFEWNEADYMFGVFSFDLFSRRVLGLDAYSIEGNWVFGTSWADIDNTPEGAARRMEWLLDNGLPENSIKQRFGNSPLCYKKEGEIL